MYKILLSRKAEKQIPLLKGAGLDRKARTLLDMLSQQPFQNPPSYEKLVGNFKGTYSRRINSQHRLVYTVDEDQHEVFILSMWTHYE